MLTNACYKNATQSNSVAKPQASIPQHSSELAPELRKALAARGCPEWIPAAAMMKSGDTLMDCAALRTLASGWAFWYWRDVRTEESDPSSTETFMLVRTVLKNDAREIQSQFGPGSQGYSENFSQQHAYGKGQNRIDILDLDGDGRDEILETIRGGQQGIYWSEYSLFQANEDGTMNPMTAPVQGITVVDFDQNDDGETVCNAELTIKKKGKLPQLVYRSSIFLPNNPNAQECPEPQHLRLSVQGAAIATQDLGSPQSPR